jgi:hypothetical protein
MKYNFLINKADLLAVETCRNLIKNLLVSSEMYNISSLKFNTLLKAYNALEVFPEKKLNGYIDVSANTYLIGGALDYSSFTIGEDYIEIYTGFIKYENGECDDSSWEKIYSSKDESTRKSLSRALECWAESFLLHLDENPSKSLLVIDKSNIDGDNAVAEEINPNPKTGTPEYNYVPLVAEYEEVPF